jgi:hypothetical protein
MSAELATGTKIESGIPRALFRYATDPYDVTYASTGDGSRFLTIEEGQKNEGLTADGGGQPDIAGQKATTSIFGRLCLRKSKSGSRLTG